MKQRFTDEQILAIIKEQESGEKTADVCRRHGISSAPFYKYKSKYGGMEAHLPRREAAGAAQRWPEACFGHKEANGAAGWSKPTLEFGFRI